MPVRLFAYHGKLQDTLTFANNLRTQFFYSWLSYKVDSLVFDTDAVVLSRDSIWFDKALGVSLADNQICSMRVIVDQTTNSLLCDLAMPAEEGDRIELYNTLGVHIEQIPLQYEQTHGSLSTSSLPNGLYFVRYISKGKQFVVKTQIVR
jgi:hypothetical protein